MAEQRVQEAAKLGFETCILPQVCKEALAQVKGIRLIGVRNVKEALEAVVKS
jgi:DNA repair protein RadA/Sms